jgi:hypothetical protein
MIAENTTTNPTTKTPQTILEMILEEKEELEKEEDILAR